MAQKQLPVDFKEFIQLLNSHEVRYVLIGGWAVGVYAEPRFTADIDFFIDSSRANLDAVILALADFGLSNVPKDIFDPPNDVFRIGRSPLQIEILTEVKNLDFEDTWEKRSQINIAGTPIFVIDKQSLIANKQSVARPKDLSDLAALKAADTSE